MDDEKKLDEPLNERATPEEIRAHIEEKTKADAERKLEPGNKTIMQRLNSMWRLFLSLTGAVFILGIAIGALAFSGDPQTRDIIIGVVLFIVSTFFVALRDGKITIKGIQEVGTDMRDFLTGYRRR